MLNNLISPVVAFLIALIPMSSVLPINQLTNNSVTILFTGDVMLGRSVMGASIDNNDPYYSFRNTAYFLKNTDLTFVNLENPIIKNCPRHTGGFKFCTNYEIADGLTFAGIDVVSLANNHTYNYGKEGIEETKNYLDSRNINYVGQNNLVVKEIKGIKFGFLGFDYVTSQVNIERDLELIKTSDPQVDVLIVSPHWGIEYQSIASSRERIVAEKMIENGTDLIIGHHPHWVQNYEGIGEVPVYYSLGNFVFDQMWSEETKKGMVVKITFDGKEIIKREEFKTYISKIGQPILLE